MDREAVDALIATIDGALGDRETSRDAMRWTPDNPATHDTTLAYRLGEETLLRTAFNIFR